MYDITDEKSFENIQNWMKSIKEVSRIQRDLFDSEGRGASTRHLTFICTHTHPPFPPQNASAGVSRMLLGNKCDIEAKRKVSKETGEKVRRPWRKRAFVLFPFCTCLMFVVLTSESGYMMRKTK